jgi:hypothetical protein
MNNNLNKKEAHKHFFIGENKQWFPNESLIVHVGDPRCCIRFPNTLEKITSFENFYKNIVEIQWIDGEPSDSIRKQVVINAWDFLAMEKRILEGDLLDIGDLKM